MYLFHSLSISFSVCFCLHCIIYINYPIDSLATRLPSIRHVSCRLSQLEAQKARIVELEAQQGRLSGENYMLKHMLQDSRAQQNQLQSKMEGVLKLMYHAFGIWVGGGGGAGGWIVRY
jgi:hypothetical protein